MVVHDDADWIRRQITELTDRNEQSFEEPWAVADAPADYIDKVQRAIVGIELEVGEVRAKRKLSQNRPADDRAGARRGLLERDARSAAVAESMDPT